MMKHDPYLEMDDARMVDRRDVDRTVFAFTVVLLVVTVALLVVAGIETVIHWWFAGFGSGATWAHFLESAATPLGLVLLANIFWKWRCGRRRAAIARRLVRDQVRRGV